MKRQKTTDEAFRIFNDKVSIFFNELSKGLKLPELLDWTSKYLKAG